MGSGHTVRHMTSGNRVEALETRVAELEATVEGLTEELVEANERIRQIEAALGGEADASEASDHGEVLEPSGWDPSTEDGSESTESDDASHESPPGVGVDDEGAAEADKTRETEGGDEEELDDIIVA